MRSWTRDFAPIQPNFPGFGFRTQPNSGLALDGDDLLLLLANSTGLDLNSAQFSPTSDNILDLGDSVRQFQDIYLGGQIKGALAVPVAFTPTLTATTTNPTLGTGGAATGVYVDLGPFVLGWGNILFGSASTSAGSGNYRIALPIAANATNHPSNAAIGAVASICAGLSKGPSVLRISTTQSLTSVFDGVANAQFSATSPGAWTTNDHINFFFLYTK